MAHIPPQTEFPSKSTLIPKTLTRIKEEIQAKCQVTSIAVPQRVTDFN